MKKLYLDVVIPWFAVIAFAFPLLIYAYKGTYIRTNGDDYCYGAIIKQYGFIKAQSVSYNEIDIYNGNRYSLNFVMGMATSLPPESLGFIPILSLAAWGLSIFFVFFQLRNILGIRSKLPEILVLSEALLFFTLYRTPNLTEVLFWVAGLTPYLLPLIFNTLLLGILFYLSQKQKVSWGWYLPVFMLAFIGGGFSETTAVLELLWLCLFFLGSLRFKKADRRYLLVVVIALLASGLSLFLLAYSPSIVTRWLNHSHSPLPIVGLRAIEYGMDFVVDSMKRSYLPALASFTIALFLSLLYGPRLEILRKAMVFTFIAVGISLASFLLIASSIAPSVYAQNAYPGDRALLPAEYIEVAWLTLLGWLFGQWIGHFQMTGVRALSLIAIVMLALYPLRASISIAHTVQRFHTWQELWDMRYRQIQKAQKNGTMDLEVIKIDLNNAYDLDFINDLRQDPKFHYNKCAAQYYGLHSIIADLYPPPVQP